MIAADYASTMVDSIVEQTGVGVAAGVWFVVVWAARAFLRRHQPTKLMVYISATEKDLRSYSQAAKEAVKKAGAEYTARKPDESPETAWQLAPGRIEGVDLFVGLYAYRYGQVAEGDRSLTDLELTYALDQGTPRALWLHPEHAVWSPAQMDPRGGPMDDLRARVAAAGAEDLPATPARLREAVVERIRELNPRAQLVADATDLSALILAGALGVVGILAVVLRDALQGAESNPWLVAGTGAVAFLACYVVRFVVIRKL